MLFIEPVFLFLFFPAVFAGNIVCPRSWRNIFLAFASLLFYALSDLEFFPLLVLSILMNFLLGMCLERIASRRYAWTLLLIGVLMNLAPFLYAKYSSFSFGTTSSLPSNGGFLLPVGLSFYTLFALSYIIEIYRGRLHACRSLAQCTLYLSFFSHLLAGPISRATDFIPQLASERGIDISGIEVGIKRIIIGLTKKILIADKLALIADAAFSTPTASLTMPAAWIGAFSFSLQIYFDFSGYSDMAIGIARLFGFRLPENFNYPYLATSVADFWRRWHMSLMQWLREYVYFPMGGSRISTLRTCMNIVVVFILSGLWHGRGWTFLLWGVYFGILLSIERLLGERIRGRMPIVLRRVITLLLVMFGWVIFRSPSIPLAMEFFRSLFGIGMDVRLVSPAFVALPQLLLMLVSAILALPLRSLFRDTLRLTGDHASLRSRCLCDFAYLVLLICSIAGISTMGFRSFLYSQF